MNIGVPSRFSCLNIDDEEASDRNRPRELKKKAPNDGKPTVKKTEKVKTGKKSAKTKKPTAQQWEEWKQKDSELVHDNFETDLQSAILLSKIDYEQNKDLYNQPREAGKEKSNSESKKKKKIKSMSLDQFLDSGKVAPVSNQANGEVKPNVEIKDENYFKRISLEAKEELKREQILETRKEREATIDEVVTIAQYQEKLKNEKAKNLILQHKLEKAKAEILMVKTRNKTLCEILGSGEMKDKADVLLEMERLNTIRNELTDEVARLHVLLEQERSKVVTTNNECVHKNCNRNLESHAKSVQKKHKKNAN